MTAAALNTEFNSYGDTGGKWTSGDSTVSIPLPDGRDAWLFSDSLIGTVNADHTLPKNTPMVNNSIVVQDGSDLVQTLHGGSAAAPTSLVRPTDGSADKYWVGDGFFYGGSESSYRSRLRCEAYKRANIRFGYGRVSADIRGPDLPRHEVIHSDAYARYPSAANFLADYGIQSAYSKLTTGNPYEANRFEKEANLYWGGYFVFDTGRRYGGTSECNWLY
ncbi:hypothetical protein ACWD69_12680 [Micromonospora chokoriensis]